MGFPQLTADAQASLVVRIRQGDAGAEAQLVELFSRSVRVMARVRAGRRLEEEDLTQEVLMAVITALRKGQLRDVDRLSAFVAGVARNVINNRLRTSQGRALEPLDGHEDAAVADLRQEVAIRERTATVRRVLAELSPGDQRLLELTMIEGFTTAQTAQRLGVSEEVIRARKSRALKRLKERLKT
jgi:RNA polymerase sigma-70 factor, ECF subfamily